jgi:hypothetical protein
MTLLLPMNRNADILIGSVRYAAGNEPIGAPIVPAVHGFKARTFVSGKSHPKARPKSPLGVRRIKPFRRKKAGQNNNKIG